MLAAVYAVLLYVATAVFLGGLAVRVWQYASTPNPLKIVATPAPTTAAGVCLRLVREVAVFESLFKANKWIWLFGWTFHAALLVVVLRHLRYFTQPVWEWVALIQPLGVHAGFVMLASLLALWARRLVVARIRYISTPSDHLMLALLIAIAASGLAMKYAAPTDIVALKSFVLGLIYLDWQPLPADPPVLVHLGLVAVLMIVFPFSKLVHGPALLFSPTRAQVDDARERRHLVAWGRARASER